MIKIKNLNKSFGALPVLVNLSFECPDSGIVAVMGASGIGKSTLLNIIAGLQEADSGEITSDFKKISYKFQEPRLLNWLTARENVEAVTDITSPFSADYWLKKVHLADSKDKYPSELSGGMQQRVALARALAYGGDLLLLDEPFSAVDTDTKDILMSVIKEYAKNHAVILVTHDIAEAKELGADIFTIN